MLLDEPRSREGLWEGYPDRLGSTCKKTTEMLGVGCHHTGAKSRHDFWKSQSGPAPTHCYAGKLGLQVCRGAKIEGPASTLIS